ncbi:MAG: hypothetical protein FWH07_02885 [Oscillospiraceae bacterium]|nr:hypothetical protein [Oscillospiraceae bacterium]
MKSRKLFLKPIAIFMAVCTLGSIAVSAETRSSRPSTEIIIEGVDDREKVQLIINTINGVEIIEPRSILCIFGHNTAKTAALGTEHRVWATSPRCRQTIYDVTYCTRSGCNYITYTIRSQSSIHCC